MSTSPFLLPAGEHTSSSSSSTASSSPSSVALPPSSLLTNSSPSVLPLSPGSFAGVPNPPAKSEGGSGTILPRQVARKTIEGVHDIIQKLPYLSYGVQTMSSFTPSFVKSLSTSHWTYYGDPLLTKLDSTIDGALENVEKQIEYLVSSHGEEEKRSMNDAPNSSSATDTDGNAPLNDAQRRHSQKNLREQLTKQDNNMYWNTLKAKFISSRWYSTVNDILMENFIVKSMTKTIAPAEMFYNTVTDSYCHHNNLDGFLVDVRKRMGPAWDERLIPMAKAYYTTARAVSTMAGAGNFVGGALQLCQNYLAPSSFRQNVDAVMDDLLARWDKVLGSTDHLLDRILPDTGAANNITTAILSDSSGSGLNAGSRNSSANRLLNRKRTHGESVGNLADLQDSSDGSKRLNGSAGIRSAPGNESGNNANGNDDNIEDAVAAAAIELRTLNNAGCGVDQDLLSDSMAQQAVELADCTRSDDHTDEEEEEGEEEEEMHGLGSDAEYDLFLNGAADVLDVDAEDQDTSGRQPEKETRHSGSSSGADAVGMGEDVKRSSPEQRGVLPLASKLRDRLHQRLPDVQEMSRALQDRLSGEWYVTVDNILLQNPMVKAFASYLRPADHFLNTSVGIFASGERGDPKHQNHFMSLDAYVAGLKAKLGSSWDDSLLPYSTLLYNLAAEEMQPPGQEQGGLEESSANCRDRARASSRESGGSSGVDTTRPICADGTGARDVAKDALFGSFESHTSGFGSKMLEKMGFKGRLGKDEAGIINPVELAAVRGRQGMGLVAPVVNNATVNKNVPLRLGNIGAKRKQMEPLAASFMTGSSSSSSSSSAPTSSLSSSLSSSSSESLATSSAPSIHAPGVGKVKILRLGVPAGGRGVDSLLDSEHIMGNRVDRVGGTKVTKVEGDDDNEDEDEDRLANSGADGDLVLYGKTRSPYKIVLFHHTVVSDEQAVLTLHREAWLAALRRLLRDALVARSAGTDGSESAYGPYIDAFLEYLLAEVPSSVSMMGDVDACTDAESATLYVLAVHGAVAAYSTSTGTGSGQGQEQGQGGEGKEDKWEESAQTQLNNFFASSISAFLSNGKSAAKALTALKNEAYSKSAAGRLRPLPGLRSFMEQLKAKGWRAVFLHVGARDRCNFDLKELGIAKLFAAVVSGSSLLRQRRPYDELYEEAAQRAQSNAVHMVAVCSSPLQALDAAKVGALPVLLYGQHGASVHGSAGVPRSVRPLEPLCHQEEEEHKKAAHETDGRDGMTSKAADVAAGATIDAYSFVGPHINLFLDSTTGVEVASACPSSPSAAATVAKTVADSSVSPPSLLDRLRTLLLRDYASLLQPTIGQVRVGQRVFGLYKDGRLYHGVVKPREPVASSATSPSSSSSSPLTETWRVLYSDYGNEEVQPASSMLWLCSTSAGATESSGQ